MNNKKGFTLFELLCVIVILALIFLIVIPNVKNLIGSSGLKTAKESVNGYVRGINNQVNLSGYNLDNSYAIEVPNTKILESGINDLELAKVNINGPLPDYVYLVFDDTKTHVISGKFCINGYSLDYDKNAGVVKSSGNYCGNLVGGLYTENEELVISWDDLVNIYGFKYDIDYTSGVSASTDYDKASTSGTTILNKSELATGVKLVIPEGVTYLGVNLFRNNTTLETVVFPKSLVEIGDYVFRNDNFTGKLKNINFSINGELERIGRTCFYGNRLIKEIFIPYSVVTIDGNAFRGGNIVTQATSLEKVIFAPNSRLETIGSSAFAFNPNLKYIELPSSLKVIDDFAFQSCTGLTSIKIPSNVTKIGAHAFQSYIEDYANAILYVMNLKKVEFEDGSKLEYIGEQAFQGNESLEYFYVPASVKTLAPRALAIVHAEKIVFENPNGWYYTYDANATSGTNIDMSDPVKNAEQFTNYLLGYWVKRN